jgi:hypothetical protein
MTLDLNNYFKSNSKCNKYNDKEKILIEIGHSDENESSVFILNGMGIPEKYKLKFFDIFLN